MRTVHAILGVCATALIATFLGSTLVAEAVGDAGTIATVKVWVLRGLLILIPSLASAAVLGRRLAGERKAPLIRAKRGRMPFIALNGVLVLTPCAFALNALAQRGAFESVFYAIQGVEIVAGGTNLILMGMMIRDGLRLSGRLRGSRRPEPRVSQGRWT